VRDWARADGERPAAHRFAARIYEDMGAVDLAADAAARAAERAPEDGMEWARLGRLRLRLMDRDGAIDALRRAVALEPTVEALLDLALALQLAGDIGGEVSACEQAVELEPQSEVAWARLAHALARTDRVSECLAAAQRAIDLGAGGEVRQLLAQMRERERRELPAA
jgi:tetratricopeptide (TPR) repeat protein